MKIHPLLADIQKAHTLYCQLTNQQLTLRYDRERLWYELLHAGFCHEDVRCVVRYLQREIRAGRRYIGALKLSNLLQPDRFEEDLNISRARLTASSSCSHRPDPPIPSAEQQQQLRSQAHAAMAKLRQQLSPPRDNR